MLCKSEKLTPYFINYIMHLNLITYVLVQHYVHHRVNLCFVIMYSVHVLVFQYLTQLALIFVDFRNRWTRDGFLCPVPSNWRSLDPVPSRCPPLLSTGLLSSTVLTICLCCKVGSCLQY